MTFEVLVINMDKTINEGRFLSEREVEVLQLAADGLSNKQIAVKLKVSTDTIETHNRKTAAKLKAKNMKQAVAIGIRNGIIK